LLQTRRFTGCDGRAARGLRADSAQAVVRARGRLRVAQAIGRVPAAVGRRRRAVQRVLPVERHRRVYRHKVLLSAVRNAARRRRAQQTLPEHQRLVARPGRLQQRYAVAAVHRVVRRGWRIVGRDQQRLAFTAGGGHGVRLHHRSSATSSAPQPRR